MTNIWISTTKILNFIKQALLTTVQMDNRGCEPWCEEEPWKITTVAFGLAVCVCMKQLCPYM